MKKLHELLESIPSLNSNKRRAELASLMQELMDQEKNCFSCEGFCCTYAHNSMLVTPIEALEMIVFLDKENRIGEELKNNLDESIKDYRLDYELSIGRGREFRRNYTCPFFKHGPRGCSIDPEFKPYGCLGFNPEEKGVKERGHCTSYSNILSKRDEENREFESATNLELISKLKLDWNKKSIPMALKDLMEKLGL